MSRASILNAPITLADLIIAAMAAVVVWQYVKPEHMPGPIERFALGARVERDTVRQLTGQRSEPAEMSAEYVRELVEQDGRMAHVEQRARSLVEASDRVAADQVDRKARRPVRST